MKWFKHFSDAHTNEGLRKLKASMGMEGVGIWWTVLEIIALKMDETDRCHAEYTVSDWCSFLGLRQKKLSLFLVLTEFELGLKSVHSGNQLKIECRKLLELRDGWSQRLRRNSGVTPDQKEKEKEKEKPEESKANALPPFPTLSPKPPKQGKDEAVMPSPERPETLQDEVAANYNNLTFKTRNGKLIAIPKLVENNHDPTDELAEWQEKFSEIMQQPDANQLAQLNAKLKSCIAKRVDLYPVFADLQEFIADGKASNPNGLILNRLWKEQAQHRA